MKPGIVLLTLALMAGCSRYAHEDATGAGEPREARSTQAPAPVGSSALPPGELPGEYRIAGVDGHDIDLREAMTVSIGGGTIRVTWGCVRREWNYTYEGGHLASVPRGRAVPDCISRLPPEQTAVIAAFDAADSAMRTPANGIDISGGGHTVTLFSQ